MGRIIGVDFGRARVGIAISDPTKLIARPLVCLNQNPQIFEKIREIILENGETESFLVGLPLYLNGEEGDMAKEARAFGLKLEQELHLPVIFWDERLSTVQAERRLKEMNMNRKKRTLYVDAMCASIVLQSYLDLKRSC